MFFEITAPTKSPRRNILITMSNKGMGKWFLPGTTVKNTPKTPKLVISGIGYNFCTQLASWIFSGDFLPLGLPTDNKFSFYDFPSSSRWLWAALGFDQTDIAAASLESSFFGRIFFMPFRESNCFSQCYWLKPTVKLTESSYEGNACSIPKIIISLNVI